MRPMQGMLANLYQSNLGFDKQGSRKILDVQRLGGKRLCLAQKDSKTKYNTNYQLLSVNSSIL